MPYLRELGISHLYLSPIMQSREGSSHGYDVVDPRLVSPELGGESALRELAAAGLGLIVDHVPNHMAACEENAFWADETLRSRFFDLDPVSGRHRRFFDIDGMAGVRQEDEEVFRATHQKILQLVGEGVIDGLRIDHLDGLADPAGYLRALRREGVERVWVEKILQSDEALRDWPVQGTVGYEFLNDVTALFVDQWGKDGLSETYAEFTGEKSEFWEIALESQLEQARSTFRPEIERLRRVADLPGITEALARLPVYRTYVDPAAGDVADADRGAIEWAQMPADLAGALLLQSPAPQEFVTRFQQTSPPIMAKGVEDTAFYRYGRLLALNEVGGDPERFGISVESFHARNLERGLRFPRGLLATSTHDTKRSADVRARIGVLAGIPGEWRERVMRWRSVNAPLVEAGAPDPAEEYALYQTLVGAWPIERDRLVIHMRKALREAKLRTSWLSPDEELESRVDRFCSRLLGHRPFLDDFEPFAARVAELGRRASLGQTLLKLTCPGVPDFFQGEELELLRLVDPDNRGPVDWRSAAGALAELNGGARPAGEASKLAVIVAALSLRARRPAPFDGSYTPVAAGPAVCAFTRGAHEVLVVVELRPGPIRGLVLPDGAAGEWRDVLSQEVHELERIAPLEQMVGEHGLALLERL